MASSFVRSTFGGHILRAGKQAAFAPTIFVRGKATLPDLPCELSELLNSHLCSSYTIADHDFNRRLWCSRAGHLGQDHGASPFKASPNLCQLLQ